MELLVSGLLGCALTYLTKRWFDHLSATLSDSLGEQQLCAIGTGGGRRALRYWTLGSGWLLFVLSTFWAFGASLSLPTLWLLLLVYIGIALGSVDIVYRHLPNVAVGLMGVVAAAGIYAGYGTVSVEEGVVGAAVGLILLLLPALVWPRALGAGDGKLACVIGVVLGAPKLVAALYLAVVLGGAIAGLLLLLRVVGRKAAFPFGPFILTGAGVVGFYGEGMVGVYEALFR